MVCDGHGRPLLLYLAEGQANDHKAAAAIVEALPPARHLLADRAYSSIGFRDALAQRGSEPAVRPRRRKARESELVFRVGYQASDKSKNLQASALAERTHQSDTKDGAKAKALAEEIGDKVQIEEITPKVKKH